MSASAGLIVAAVCAFAAAVALVWLWRRNAALRERARSAEDRLALLERLAPALTEAAVNSTAETCRRVVERFRSLVRAQSVLCFVVVDGRMVLGGKSDEGFAGFLKTGESYEGDSILDWVRHNGIGAIVGPANAMLAPDTALVDISMQPDGLRLGGPLVGSRDRVWALCLPMTTPRGRGVGPAVVGAIYAERKRDDPFRQDDLLAALLVASLGGDALQRAQFADDVKRESEFDQLTKLLTAATFRKRLRQAIEARRFDAAHKDVALFFIDTDKFKLWNDTFGHSIGDALLKKLAQTFHEVAATGGFAGRNGGDEFCIALLDRTKDDAIEVAESLRERVERTDFLAAADGIPQPRIPITISIGVAHFPVDVPIGADAPADRLLEAADARMYDAKRDGRNRVAYARARSASLTKR